MNSGRIGCELAAVAVFCVLTIYLFSDAELVFREKWACGSHSNPPLPIIGALLLSRSTFCAVA